MAAVAACDPDLTPVTTGGGDAGGREGGAPPVTTPTGDGGTTPTDDSGAGDAGDDAPVTTGHKIDGVNDFDPTEKFPTTSLGSGYEAYFGWDATRLYFGMSGADVGGTATNKWVHVYLGLDATPGTTTGIDYGGEQQPTLPFSAAYHVRWKTSGDFTTVEKWSGAAWEPTSVALVPILAARQGQFMELSLTRASLGSPTTLRVHMNMLIEGGGNDWTYAGVPSTSFTDGKDPDFGKYLEFDLADTTKAPNTYAPKP